MIGGLLSSVFGAVNVHNFSSEYPSHRLADIKIINEDVILRDKINDFILDNCNIDTNITTSKLNKNKKKIMDSFKKNAILWGKEHNIHARFILLYFSLDIKLYPLLLCDLVKPIEEFLYFYVGEHKVYVDGKNVTSILKNNDSYFVNEFKYHVENLPLFTQKIVRLIIAETNPKNAFEKISNQFDYRALINTLKNETDSSEFLKHFNYLMNAQEDQTKMISSYFLYCAILHLESNLNDVDNVNNIKEEILSYFCKTINSLITSSPSEANRRDVSKIHNCIEFNGQFIIDILNSQFIGSFSFPTSYFFYTLTDLSNEINILEIKMCENLGENLLDYVGIDIFDSDSDFKKAFINEAIRQLQSNSPDLVFEKGRIGRLG